MKLLLAGCGAVGLSVASALFGGGEAPDLLARGETKTALEKDGLRRVGLLGEAYVPPARLRVYETPQQTPGGYDAVLVATKATAAADIRGDFAACPGLLAPHGRVVLLQNGFGAEHPYLSVFGKERFVQASISIGFARDARNVSRVTVFSAPVMLGSLYGDDALVPELAAAINAGGIPCHAAADVGKAIWEKMLFNVSLNALGALLHTDYGHLAASEHACALIRALLRETFAVMRAAGFSVEQPDEASFEEYFFTKRLPPAAAHRSSTLQDVSTGAKRKWMR